VQHPRHLLFTHPNDNRSIVEITQSLLRQTLQILLLINKLVHLLKNCHYAYKPIHQYVPYGEYWFAKVIERRG